MAKRGEVPQCGVEADEQCLHQVVDARNRVEVARSSPKPSRQDQAQVSRESVLIASDSSAQPPMDTVPGDDRPGRSLDRCTSWPCRRCARPACVDLDVVLPIFTVALSARRLLKQMRAGRDVGGVFCAVVSTVAAGWPMILASFDRPP
jgi:hypothetical protein